jgi:(1->4)-alpha-D-glucan 1-alpha-D-glucosylmutase
VDELHAHFARVERELPCTLIATSTHDTKRSEDVRMRLIMLTHDPGAWQRFACAAAEHLAASDAQAVVDGPTRYLLLQTLVGAWPIDEERLARYLEKAVREAKKHTSWTSPQADYEAALRAMVAAVVRDRALCALCDDFVAELDGRARRAALAQLALKLTLPGVPDIYQGTELWAHQLTDPDNRAPVDFATRRALLARAKDADAESALREVASGLPKLWLLSRGLALRGRLAEAFAGSYLPLVATPDDRREAIVAFVRGAEVVVAVPTRFDGASDEAGIELPPGRWRDTLGTRSYPGGVVSGRDLFCEFPAVILVKDVS